MGAQRSWDGVPGPKKLSNGLVEYPAWESVDYVHNALSGTFSMALTSRVDAREYKARILAMLRVYSSIGELEPRKRKLNIFSFLKIERVSSAQLATAQAATSVELTGDIYRVEGFRHAAKASAAAPPGRVLMKTRSWITIFVGGGRTLLIQDGGPWRAVTVDD